MYKYLTVKRQDREFIGQAICRVLTERAITAKRHNQLPGTVVAIVPRMTTFFAQPIRYEVTEVEIILVDEDDA